MEKINKKVKKYEQIIIELLEKHQFSATEDQLVIDKKNHHYQLLYIGADNRNCYLSKIQLHFHLREDGIICIFENRTEEEVVDTLMLQGVPKSDILVGFLPQSARKYAGYAVA